MKNSKGITLIEVLTAVAIVALLTGVLLPVISRARIAGDRGRTVSNLRQLGQQIELYVSEYESAPTNLSNLLAPAGSITPSMLLVDADPYRGFGSLWRECRGQSASPRTSFEHILDWRADRLSNLEKFDPNHGIVAVRVFGDRTEYFAKAETNFCAYRDYVFEGTMLRLRKDTSVQTRQLRLHWGIHTGSAGITPGFSLYDLYVDGYPSPFDR